MPNHVPRLLLDQQRRLQHVPFGGILGLDDGQFIGRIVAEHVLEKLVEPRRVLHQPVGRASFVEDRHRGAVQFRLLENILVDEVAENVARLGLLLAQDRRAGKADDGGIGQCLAQVAVQRARVRTVRLVHQDEDVRRTHSAPETPRSGYSLRR